MKKWSIFFLLRIYHTLVSLNQSK